MWSKLLSGRSYQLLALAGDDAGKVERAEHAQDHQSVERFHLFLLRACQFLPLKTAKPDVWIF